MCRPCLRGCTWQRCGLRLPSWIWGTRSHLGGLNSDFAMRCHASSQVMLEEFGVPRRFLGLTTVTYDGKVCLGQLEQVYVTVDGCTSKLFRLERFLCLVLKRCFRRASSFSSFSSTVCFFFFVGSSMPFVQGPTLPPQSRHRRHRRHRHRPCQPQRLHQRYAQMPATRRMGPQKTTWFCVQGGCWYLTLASCFFLDLYIRSYLRPKIEDEWYDSTVEPLTWPVFTAGSSVRLRQAKVHSNCHLQRPARLTGWYVIWIEAIAMAAKY